MHYAVPNNLLLAQMLQHYNEFNFFSDQSDPIYIKVYMQESDDKNTASIIFSEKKIVKIRIFFVSISNNFVTTYKEEHLCKNSSTFFVLLAGQMTKIRV